MSLRDEIAIVCHGIWCKDCAGPVEPRDFRAADAILAAVRYAIRDEGKIYDHDSEGDSCAPAIATSDLFALLGENACYRG